jgi:hypothetical protein
VAATFADPTPAGIAAAVGGLVRDELHAEIAAYEFFAASVSSVVGLRLASGDRVVVKVHRGEASSSYLLAVQQVQDELARGGFPSPMPLLGPTELGPGVAIVESLLDRGVRPNAFDPSERRVLAAGLAGLIERCRHFVGVPGLEANFMARGASSLWPRPYDLRFDFEGTTAGAEWIDEIAHAAKAVRDDGEHVVGHTDWRVEHVRIEDGALSAVYDWDLVVASEPSFVGGAAHGFIADWSVPGRRQVPTGDEAQAFIDDYEVARGRPFTDDERHALNAALVYAMAYTARCAHSDASTDFGRRAPMTSSSVVSPGSAAAFLQVHAAELLAT